MHFLQFMRFLLLVHYFDDSVGTSVFSESDYLVIQKVNDLFRKGKHLTFSRDKVKTIIVTFWIKNIQTCDGTSWCLIIS